jgi:hypothetical protein
MIGAAAGRRRVMPINPIQLQKFLGGVDYPADKRRLIDAARANGADDNVVQTLQDLPMDQFNSPNDVSEAVGRS